MFDIFAEKVSSRSSHLENDMIQRWSNLSESVENILAETDKTLIFHGKTIEDITYQDDLTDELLSNLSSHVLYLLRKNSVTGAFVILDCDGTDRKKMCIRDRDLPVSHVRWWILLHAPAKPGYRPTDRAVFPELK